METKKLQLLKRIIREELLKEDKTNFEQLLDRWIAETSKSIRTPPKAVARMACKYLQTIV